MSLTLQPEDIEEQPTPESVVLEQRKLLTQWYANMRSSYERRFNDIWNNPLFNAPELVTQYGNDAVTLFQASSKMAELLVIVDPTYVPPSVPSKYSFTMNQNGSVTVTEN